LQAEYSEPLSGCINLPFAPHSWMNQTDKYITLYPGRDCKVTADNPYWQSVPPNDLHSTTNDYYSFWV
jgi:hypothetical protein